MTHNHVSAGEALEILRNLANSHPDYAAFAAELSASNAPDAEVPPEILRQTLAVLSEDPEQATLIRTIRENPSAARKFGAGPEALSLIALVFLLRTHIRIERSPNGKWKFLIEHKASDNKLLTALLGKLEDWLGGGDS